MSGEECYKTFYSCLVELLVWQFYGGTVVKISKGDPVDRKGAVKLLGHLKSRWTLWMVCLYDFLVLRLQFVVFDKL